MDGGVGGSSTAIHGWVARGRENLEMNMRKIRLLSMACLIVLAIVWILQNRDPVQTRFLFVSVIMPQSALLTITLLAGIATGMLLALEQSKLWSRKNPKP